MSAPSQRPQVIDLTEEDEIANISSNELSDANSTQQEPSALQSGSSTPNSKKRKRRKKAKSLNAVLAEQVKQKLSAEVSKDSVDGDMDISEVIDLDLFDDSRKGANQNNRDRREPLDKGMSVSRKHQASSHSPLFDLDSSRGEVLTANTWDGALPGSNFGIKPESNLTLVQGLLLPGHATIVEEGSTTFEQIMLEAEASFAQIDPNEESFVDFQDDDKVK